jgi:hypothetical protein
MILLSPGPVMFFWCPECHANKTVKKEDKKQGAIKTAPEQKRFVQANPWPGSSRGWGPITRKLEGDI